MDEEGCFYQEKTTQHENLVRYFNVNCKKEHIIALPLFSSKWHAVMIDDFASLNCIERTDLPGLCALKLPVGKSTLQVYLPTFGRIINK